MIIYINFPVFSQTTNWDIRISYKCKNLTTAQILKDISQKYNLNFSYSSEITNKQKYSFNENNVLLSTFLTKLLEPQKIKYSFFKNQIILNVDKSYQTILTRKYEEEIKKTKKDSLERLNNKIDTIFVRDTVYIKDTVYIVQKEIKTDTVFKTDTIKTEKIIEKQIFIEKPKKKYNFGLGLNFEIQKPIYSFEETGIYKDIFLNSSGFGINFQAEKYYNKSSILLGFSYLEISEKYKLENKRFKVKTDEFSQTITRTEYIKDTTDTYYYIIGNDSLIAYVIDSIPEKITDIQTVKRTDTTFYNHGEDVNNVLKFIKIPVGFGYKFYDSPNIELTISTNGIIYIPLKSGSQMPILENSVLTQSKSYSLLRKNLFFLGELNFEQGFKIYEDFIIKTSFGLTYNHYSFYKKKLNHSDNFISPEINIGFIKKL